MGSYDQNCFHCKSPFVQTSGGLLRVEPERVTECDGKSLQQLFNSLMGYGIDNGAYLCQKCCNTVVKITKMRRGITAAEKYFFQFNKPKISEVKPPEVESSNSSKISNNAAEQSSATSQSADLSYTIPNVIESTNKSKPVLCSLCAKTLSPELVADYLSSERFHSKFDNTVFTFFPNSTPKQKDVSGLLYCFECKEIVDALNDTSYDYETAINNLISGNEDENGEDERDIRGPFDYGICIICENGFFTSSNKGNNMLTCERYDVDDKLPENLSRRDVLKYCFPEALLPDNGFVCGSCNDDIMTVNDVIKTIDSIITKNYGVTKVSSTLRNGKKLVLHPPTMSFLASIIEQDKPALMKKCVKAMNIKVFNQHIKNVLASETTWFSRSSILPKGVDPPSSNEIECFEWPWEKIVFSAERKMPLIMSVLRYALNSRKALSASEHVSAVGAMLCVIMRLRNPEFSLLQKQITIQLVNSHSTGTEIFDLLHEFGWTLDKNNTEKFVDQLAKGEKTSGEGKPVREGNDDKDGKATINSEEEDNEKPDKSSDVEENKPRLESDSD